MPTTSSKKTVAKKPAAKAAKAPAAQATKVKAEATPKAKAVKAAPAPAPKVAKAAAAVAVKAPVKTPAVKTQAKAPAAKKAPAPKAEPKVEPKAEPKAEMKAELKPEPKAAKPKAPAAPAPAPAKKAVPKKPAVVWVPREVPIHEIDGKAADPRLAAALAARERWHGRSGRPALKSSTQAVAFVRERRLVHASVRSPLPNLIDPVVGRSCSDEDRTTGQPALTLRGWRKEIDAAPDILEARLCFERPTLISSELWPALITVALPREIAAEDGGLISEEAVEALEILDRKGSVPSDRLRQMLGLEEKAFDRVHAELESQLLVLSRGALDEDDQPIVRLERFSRWADRAMPKRAELEVGRAWTFLFIAALRSAVVLWPEEIDGLFPWTRAEREAALAEAASTGAVITYTEGDSIAYVASPVPR